MNVRGEYSPTIAYQPMDIVTYQNGSYMAKVATTGSAPTNTSKWDKLMQGSSDYAVAAENTGIKWIDGRPVYRRILTGTSLTDAGSTTIGNIGPVDVIIRLDGFVRRPTGGLQTFGFAYYANPQQMVTANVTKEGDVVVYKGNAGPPNTTRWSFTTARLRRVDHPNQPVSRRKFKMANAGCRYRCRMPCATWPSR